LRHGSSRADARKFAAIARARRRPAAIASHQIDHLSVDNDSNAFSLTKILRKCGVPEHDPEKWKPVFGKDHAQTRIQSVMAIQLEVITL
jgi:hypothetical protein